MGIRMGIRMKSILIMGILGFVAIGIIGFTSYRLSVANALHEAQIKSDLVLNYAMATRQYMQKVQRPLTMQLVERDRFYPELMSGFVSARGTFELFQEMYPGYVFKQATLDPLHPSNRADDDEARIIQHLAQNPALESVRGQMSRNGEDQYYFAQPIRIESAGCLTCHGNPDDAPKDQVEIYGSENGYNWKMNDTVAAFFVYVPTAEAMAAARHTALILVLVGAAAVLILLGVIGWFLNRQVVSPLLGLATLTERFSLGQDLDTRADTGRSDEIGALSKAIERLRVSLNIMMKRKRA